MHHVCVPSPLTAFTKNSQAYRVRRRLLHMVSGRGLRRHRWCMSANFATAIQSEWSFLSRPFARRCTFWLFVWCQNFSGNPVEAGPDHHHCCQTIEVEERGRKTFDPAGYYVRYSNAQVDADISHMSMRVGMLSLRIGQNVEHALKQSYSGMNSIFKQGIHTSYRMSLTLCHIPSRKHSDIIPQRSSLSCSIQFLVAKTITETAPKSAKPSSTLTTNQNPLPCTSTKYPYRI